jgi:cellulose synthase/poly-beta-1,6-N-acetylglucosamine synthase-like glycosyltransferase
MFWMVPDPTPLVSVLLPCYNAAGTLAEALESLVCQSLTNFEIIAVEDGSLDNTMQVLRNWAARDRRIQVYQQKHGGIIQALNSGLAACRAPYVARMDSDDRCHPERLERQVAFLDSRPEIGLVSCRVTGFPAEQVRAGFQIYLDWLNSFLSDVEIRREMFIESSLPHPSVTFRRHVVEQAGGYQEHGWPEDYDLWLRLYQNGVHFARLPETLLEWREHPQRLTHTDGRYSVENFLRAKAYYLARGPLAGRQAVIIWGAGMMGRRLCKQLERQGTPLVAFIDVDPRKIGHVRRGLPVVPPSELPDLWNRLPKPVLLAAVGARGARTLIRQQLQAFGLQEGLDWWGAA